MSDLPNISAVEEGPLTISNEGHLSWAHASREGHLQGWSISNGKNLAVGEGRAQWINRRT